MDRRDLLLDQLSGYGQVSVEQLASGSTNVSFVDRDDRHHATRSSPTRPRLGRPARRRLEPGRPDRRPARGRQDRRHDRRLPRADRLVLPDARRHGQRGLRRRLLHRRHARRARRSASPRRSRPPRPASAPAPAPPAPTTSRSRSPSCAATPRIDGAYKAFVAKVGGDLNESHAHAGQRPGARRLRRGPPPERGRASRWTRRCPTSCASSAPTRPRRVPCRRWTRCSTSSSTGPERSACSHAHHDLHGPAQRPLGPQHALREARQDAVQGRLRQGDHAPVGRSVQHRARDGPARDASAPTTSTSATSTTRRAGRTRPSPRWTRSPSTSTAPTTCCCRAPRTPPTRARATRSPPRSTRSSRASRRPRTPATATSYLMSGTATSTSRPTSSATTTPTRATTAAWTPTVPGVVREIGPGVTMSINSVGARDPRRRPRQPDRRQAAQRAARHLRPPEGQRRRRAARRRHHRACRTASTHVLEVRARNGAHDEPPRGRRHAASTRSTAR